MKAYEVFFSLQRLLLSASAKATKLFIIWFPLKIALVHLGKLQLFQSPNQSFKVTLNLKKAIGKGLSKYSRRFHGHKKFHWTLRAKRATVTPCISLEPQCILEDHKKMTRMLSLAYFLLLRRQKKGIGRKAAALEADCDCNQKFPEGKKGLSIKS